MALLPGYAAIHSTHSPRTKNNTQAKQQKLEVDKNKDNNNDKIIMMIIVIIILPVKKSRGGTSS